jgi:hypothetical protein
MTFQRLGKLFRVCWFSPRNHHIFNPLSDIARQKAIWAREALMIKARQFCAPSGETLYFRIIPLQSLLRQIPLPAEHLDDSGKKNILILHNTRKRALVKCFRIVIILFKKAWQTHTYVHVTATPLKNEGSDLHVRELLWDWRLRLFQDSCLRRPAAPFTPLDYTRTPFDMEWTPRINNSGSSVSERRE